jgi:hypothetical protein
MKEPVVVVFSFLCEADVELSNRTRRLGFIHVGMNLFPIVMKKM